MKGSFFLLLLILHVEKCGLFWIMDDWDSKSYDCHFSPQNIQFCCGLIEMYIVIITIYCWAFLTYAFFAIILFSIFFTHRYIQVSVKTNILAKCCIVLYCMHAKKMWFSLKWWTVECIIATEFVHSYTQDNGYVKRLHFIYPLDQISEIRKPNIVLTNTLSPTAKQISMPVHLRISLEFLRNCT